MRYLLDSNAVIALMAHDANLHPKVSASAPGSVVLSSIVLFELLFGAFNSKRVALNLERIDDLAFPVLEFDKDDARAAGEIRAKLKAAGTPIGPYDLLIAGQAVSRGLTIITANGREFERVEGLAVEDWTRPDR